ncbi:MAG TPA: DUF2933 domain-containing protein [Myxococcota bacterium]|nr:DUF2933 domain-containing protein [Myxococcota bacterium]
MPGASPTSERTSRVRWVFAGFLAIAAYLLVSEHRAHLAQALPWLIVAACPLMHVFMHRGHERHRSPTDGT